MSPEESVAVPSEELVYVPSESYTSARATTTLVGLENELAQIKVAIEDSQTSYIIYVRGEGGIGKTRLVREILKPREPYNPTLALTLADNLIDLYHTRVRSLAGLIEALLEVTPPLARFLAQRQDEAGQDALARLTEAENEGLALGDIISRRRELTELFLQVLNEFTQKHRLVLVLDTAERLLVQHDPTQAELELTERRPFILDWLLEDFLPRVQNVVVVLAGRPALGRLSQALADIESKTFVQIDLHGFSEDQALKYFDEIITTLKKSGKAEDRLVAETIEKNWLEEFRRTIFYALCEENGEMYIRPLLLALAIDHLALTNTPLAALPATLDDARQLNQDQRAEIQFKLGQALVRRLKNSLDPAHEVILALGWLRKGATPELISKIIGLDQPTVNAALEKIKKLSFVKMHHGSQRIFLHDEMYQLLKQHLLEVTNPKRREEIAGTLSRYYKEEIDRLEQQITALYQPMAGLQQSMAPEARQVLLARTRLQDALVEDLRYHLEWKADEGFQTYFLYAEGAITTNDENLDVQLQMELLSFLHEQDSEGEMSEINGLSRADVYGDAAVRWIKRLTTQDRQTQALDVVKRLRREAAHLIEAAHPIAKYDLDSWEALALAHRGELEEAEQQLRQTIEQLQNLPIESDQAKRQRAIIARAHNNLGYILRTRGRFHGAINSYQQAVPLWRATKLKVEQANTLNNRAFALAEVGKFDVAEQLAWDALEMRERLGPLFPVSLSLNTLAHIKIRENAYEEGLRFANRAYALAEKLGSKRAKGLALVALSEAKRRFSIWDPHPPTETVRWLKEAIENGWQAVEIFAAAYSPIRRVEALIELGCAYRDWAKIKHDFPDEAPGNIDELIAEAETALQEAANLAREHNLPYRQMDALVDLGWLWYYIHPDVQDEEQVQSELTNGILSPINEIIPQEYKITPRQRSQFGAFRGGIPDIDIEEAVFPLITQLAKIELLYGQIAFSQFEFAQDQRSEPALAALKKAVGHYTLSLEYNNIVNPGQIFRDIRRAMGEIYERLKPLNIEELLHVYRFVEELEDEYALDISRMRTFLEDRFGPRTLLVDL